MKRAFILLLLAPALLRAQTADEKQKTIDYVNSLRQPDGGFAINKEAKGSSLRATNAAIRSLKYFGGELKDADKAAKYVMRCFDKQSGQSGTYLDSRGGKTDVALTAVGIMAAVELKLPAEPYVSAAANYVQANAKDFEEIRIAAAGLEAAGTFDEKTVNGWLDKVNKMRNDDGSYGEPKGDARMTGSAVAFIKRLQLPLDAEATAKSLKVMQAGQRPEGGFGKAGEKGSDLETTYRVMRAFHLLKQKPNDVAKLKEYIAKCRNADGGYGVTPGSPSNLGGTYYAAIILHWLDS